MKKKREIKEHYTHCAEVLMEELIMMVNDLQNFLGHNPRKS